MPIRWRIGSGPKAEKSGQKTLPIFQRPERADVKFGNSPSEQKHPLALAETEPPQHVRKTVGEGAQVGIREIACLAALTDPSQSQVIAKRTGRVTIDCFVRDVQPTPARQTVEFAPCRTPGKSRADLFVVGEVWRDAPSAFRLFDRPVSHLEGFKLGMCHVRALAVGFQKRWKRLKQLETVSERATDRHSACLRWCDLDSLLRWHDRCCSC